MGMCRMLRCMRGMWDLALVAIAEVEVVLLVEVEKGYMQPIAEIEAAFAGLVEVQGLLLQVRRSQVQVQVQLQVPV